MKNIFFSMVLMLAFMLTLGASNVNASTVTVTLVDENGTALANYPPSASEMSYEYRCGGSWVSGGNVQTDALGQFTTADITCGNWDGKITLSLHQRSMEKVVTGGAVTFQAARINVNLKNSCTGLITQSPGGTVKQGGGHWYTHGTTAGTGVVTFYTFPGGTVKVTMGYHWKTLTQYPTIVAGTNEVDFLTTNVNIMYSGSVQYQTSGWPTVTFPIELLQGDHNLRFGGTVMTITASGCSMNLALLTLLDHNSNGLPGGKAKWADGSWHSIPGETDANGFLFADISNPNYGKIAMTYNQGTIQQNRSQLTASNYTWQTENLRIWLHDHTGSPITDLGGKVDQGGGYWFHHGYTNSSGYIDVELFARSAAYKFKMTYNYTSKTQYPVVSTGGGSEIFMTQLATVTLRENCTTNMLDGATVRYAAGSWRTFGTTGDDGPGTVSKELFPGNRKITLTYNYRSNTITHNLTTDFDFVAVPLTIVGVSNAKYAGGSWRTFTLPTMNQLPGKIKFKLDGVTTYITVEASNCTQSYAILTLLDQNGNGVEGGVAKPAYGGSWGATLSGQTDANGQLVTTELLPGFTKIKMTINQGGVEQTVAQLNASNYTWYTVTATVKLIDNAGTGIEDGSVDQGGGTWVHHGSTDANGEFMLEMFPGSYKFRMGYNYTSQTITQNIATPVIFQTGKVVGPTCTSYSAGSWRAFTNPMQLLPITTNFKFNDGTPQTSFTVKAGQTLTIPAGTYTTPKINNPEDIVTITVPLEFSLHNNYPNPFNPTTTIVFTVKEASPTTLAVYNTLGELVTTLFNGMAEPGQFYKFQIDGKDLASGMYIYRLQSGDNVSVKKMIFMK